MFKLLKKNISFILTHCHGLMCSKTLLKRHNELLNEINKHLNKKHLILAKSKKINATILCMCHGLEL